HSARCGLVPAARAPGAVAGSVRARPGAGRGLGRRLPSLFRRWAHLAAAPSRAARGAGVIRALLSYGSCLSPLTRAPDSLPDRFALVDDLAETLRALGHPSLALLAQRLIPPVTIAHEDGKLSLISVADARRELTAPRDLYLAGRLSKRVEFHFGECDDLIA